MNSNIQNKISKSRINFLKENPDKHPWKKLDKFKSKPCEHLKEVLKEKSFDFIEEYTDTRWEHNYSLDIAFLDKKIAIEVNGNQHYNSNWELNEYYQKRHDYLISQGWNVLEIHYTWCYVEDKIKEIEEAIVNNKTISFEETKILLEYKRLNAEEKQILKEKRYKEALTNGLLDKSGRINGKKYKISDLENYKNIILSSNVNLMENHFRKKLVEVTNLSPTIIEYTLNYFNINHYKLDKTKSKPKYIKKYNWNVIDTENYNKILNSGVDLTNFGWVNKVSQITKLTRRQIARIVNLTDLKDSVYIRRIKQ